MKDIASDAAAATSAPATSGSRNRRRAALCTGDGAIGCACGRAMDGISGKTGACRTDEGTLPALAESRSNWAFNDASTVRKTSRSRCDARCGSALTTPPRRRGPAAPGGHVREKALIFLVLHAMVQRIADALETDARMQLLFELGELRPAHE